MAGRVRAPGAPGLPLPTLRETGGNAFGAGSLPFLPARAATAAVPPRPRGHRRQRRPSRLVPSRPAAPGAAPAAARGSRLPGARDAVPGCCRAGPSATYGVGGGALPGVLARFPSSAGGLGDRERRLASPTHAPGPRGLVSRCSRGWVRSPLPEPEAARPAARAPRPGTARRGGLAPARPWRGSGPICNGIKRSSARTAAADRGGRGGSHGTGAARRNAGETGVRACEWRVCVRV